MSIFRKIVFLSLLLLCLWLGVQPVQAEEVGTPTPAPTAAPKDVFEGTEETHPGSGSEGTEPRATPVPTPLPDDEPSFQVATPVPFLRLRRSLLPTDRDRYYDKRTGQDVIFGCFDEDEGGAFYPCGEDGSVAYGAEPLPMSDFLVSPYAPETPPKADGDRWLTVYMGSESVVCFLAEAGDWTVERIMICSCSDELHQTPLGLHYIYSKYDYKAMTRMNGIMVYAQYACRFRGHYLFHTVPIGGDAGRRFQKYGKKQMLIEEYEKLGKPASHGCVRLLVGDAYWIYKNCPRGTKVQVLTDAGPTPPAAPALIYAEPYMNADHTLGWDPTDPDPENPYRQIYPEWFEQRND